VCKRSGHSLLQKLEIQLSSKQPIPQVKNNSRKHNSLVFSPTLIKFSSYVFEECCITIFDILGLGLLYTGTRRSFPILNKTKYADYRSNMGLSLWVKHGQIGNHHINPKKALPCTWLFARCTSVCCPFRLSLCLAFGFRRPLSRLLLTGHSGPAKRGHGYTQVMQGQMPTKCF